jgi:hypothetical protein
MVEQLPTLYKTKILEISLDAIDDRIYERCRKMRQMVPEPEKIEKAFDEGFEAYLGYFLEKNIQGSQTTLDKIAVAIQLKSAKARVRRKLGKIWKTEIPKCNIQIDFDSGDECLYPGTYNKALNHIFIDPSVFQKPEVFGWVDYVLAHEMSHSIICMARGEIGI